MKKRITISLDEEKVEKLDDLARSTSRTRSGLVDFLIGLFRPRELREIEFDEHGDED